MKYCYKLKYALKYFKYLVSKQTVHFNSQYINILIIKISIVYNQNIEEFKVYTGVQKRHPCNATSFKF